MNNTFKHKWKRENLYQGVGIRVAIKGDNDKYGNQKNRPGIVLRRYPSHVKVQLLSTEKSNYDHFSLKINNIDQYVRPIYFRTVKYYEILELWRDDNNKIIKLQKGSTFFTRIVEMQYTELFEEKLDLIKYQLENRLNFKKQNNEVDQEDL